MFRTLRHILRVGHLQGKKPLGLQTDLRGIGGQLLRFGKDKSPMKYFEHYTTDRNSVPSKLIRKRFGAQGYGVYQALLEVIGEHVKPNNIEDWGHVEKMHDLETLADECATDITFLKEFLKFCDDKKIFEKHDGRLYSALMLERLDPYSNKIKQSLTKSDKVSINRREENRTEHNRTQQNRKEEKRVETNANALQKEEKSLTKYGSEEITSLIGYLKERLGLPALDESEQVNRNYCNLLIRKFGGADKVRLLIDSTAQHKFWASRVTSTKKLYYHAVEIISSNRDRKHAVVNV